MLNIVGIVYLIGCLIAFVMGWYEAYMSQKDGKDISEFCAGIVVVTALSWFYILLSYKRVGKFLKK